MVGFDSMNSTEILDSVCSAMRGMDQFQREALLDALTKMIEAERLGLAEASNVSGCPGCRCEEYCGRTFTEQPPGNLFRYTKLDDDQWYRFVECFVNGLSLRKCATF